MFNLREFLMKGFRDAVGKMADYQVIMNATGYYEKNVLATEDLAEIQTLIDEKNTPPVEVTEGTPDGIPDEITEGTEDNTEEET